MKYFLKAPHKNKYPEGISPECTEYIFNIHRPKPPLSPVLPDISVLPQYFYTSLGPAQTLSPETLNCLWDEDPANCPWFIPHIPELFLEFPIILIGRDKLHIYTENGEIPFLKDFSMSLIESTIKGILSPLNGVFWLERITITSRET